MKFELEYIEKLASIIQEKGLSEISLEDGEQAITIRKDAPEVITSGVNIPAVAASQVAANSAEAPAEKVKRGRAIVSPMVGMFYSKPSPDAEPFVQVGDLIRPGQVVCIIEAMKLMNEIEADVSGKVVEICVDDGQPVEYGQVLMYIE